MDEEKIKKLTTEGKYEFSKHAERERELDMILTNGIEDALKNCEIIEDYPDDPRGASCLVLGFSGQRPNSCSMYDKYPSRRIVTYHSL